MIPLIFSIFDYCLIVTKVIEPLDQFVYSLCHQLNYAFVSTSFIAITQLGGFIGVVVVVLIILLFKRQWGYVCLSSAIFQQLVNRVIKNIVKRPRPGVPHLVQESSYSFPSGHAMAITCLYGLLFCYLKKSNYKYKRMMMVLCVLIVLLVDLSRVYLGVHYFSDVLGGSLLSLSLVLFIYYRTDWIY